METLAGYILSLPQKVVSLREQATVLLAEANAITMLLPGLDRAKLDTLTLTGNPKLDAALRLSMEGNGNWLSTFPKILEKLEKLESEIGWKGGGGLMFIDLTTQTDAPPCPHWIIAEGWPSMALMVVPEPGYFHSIPISVQFLARPRLSVHYSDWKVNEKNPAVVSIDLTQLLHPNWGCSYPHNKLAGLFFGDDAMRHLDDWKKHFENGYCMSAQEQEHHLNFLAEFRSAIEALPPLPKTEREAGTP